jgi:circadian clock protein KaiC
MADKSVRSRRKRSKSASPPRGALPKAPTGIPGLDQITHGGIARARTTLVCGGPGCGKTLLGLEFLLRGATEFGEPGVFMAFEETAEELAQNVRSLGFDLDALVAARKIAVDHVHVERGEIEEAGAWDLEGIFLRLGLAIDAVGAKRVVLDTIESLFSCFTNEAVLRSELRRLFRWLKDRGVAAVVTAERGEGTLTRHGLEEYVSDCVIVLDHRVRDEVSTRRMRIVKYRGTTHGTNEYPFLIGNDGISVLPLASVSLDHAASTQRISSGVAGLDAMLGGAGFYRGSSILVSGSAGTGKTTLAASFVQAACRRRERGLYLAFEESVPQLLRNMGSVGIRGLKRAIDSGLLRVIAGRPAAHGLETHLAQLHKAVTDLNPDVVVIDPITTFSNPEAQADVDSMVLRMVDFLKSRGITAMLCHSTSEDLSQEPGKLFSLIDALIALRDEEDGAERRHGVVVLKSRGTAHSNRVREYRITSKGLEFAPDAAAPARTGKKGTS